MLQVPHQVLTLFLAALNERPHIFLLMSLTGPLNCYQWRHQNFSVGASRRQNVILRGQKSKNLPKMADFGIFFFWQGGKWGGGAEPLTGGQYPHAPPWCHHWLLPKDPFFIRDLHFQKMFTQRPQSWEKYPHLDERHNYYLNEPYLLQLSSPKEPHFRTVVTKRPLFCVWCTHMYVSHVQIPPLGIETYLSQYQHICEL